WGGRRCRGWRGSTRMMALVSARAAPGVILSRRRRIYPAPPGVRTSRSASVGQLPPFRTVDPPPAAQD
ncbi:MAG: hypothetical protein AVDCRST_MAG11-432, partial [uncultured Gemmatimonadaceae bacterium]